MRSPSRVNAGRSAVTITAATLRVLSCSLERVIPKRCIMLATARAVKATWLLSPEESRPTTRP